MNLTIQIPDELARDLVRGGGDLSRRALEGFGLEEYKNRRLTKSALGQLLGFSTSEQLDGFLKTHKVDESFRSAAEVGCERQKPFDNLSDLLLHSPFAGADLNLERSEDYPRSIDLG